MNPARLAQVLNTLRNLVVEFSRVALSLPESPKRENLIEARTHIEAAIAALMRS